MDPSFDFKKDAPKMDFFTRCFLRSPWGAHQRSFRVTHNPKIWRLYWVIPAGMLCSHAFIFYWTRHSKIKQWNPGAFEKSRYWYRVQLMRQGLDYEDKRNWRAWYEAHPEQNH